MFRNKTAKSWLLNILTWN